MAAGDDFRKAGGKPERGLLFIGAPGTGKTMLSKAIATSFNSPIVTMPGSGFAQTFIGMDVIIVMFLIRKARRLARKWGGHVHGLHRRDRRRRPAPPGAGRRRRGHVGFEPVRRRSRTSPFYGPWGAQNPVRRPRPRDAGLARPPLRARARPRRRRLPPGAAGASATASAGTIIPGGMMGGMGGGLALNQLLVQMDGVDEPPFLRKFAAKRLNTFLDAIYIVPQRVGQRRAAAARRRSRAREQIYFIGATNVPIEALDPALVRPGRMGRHIWFRTPTKDDRQDIFDLYLAKVAHDARPRPPTKRRDELARITNGYSPAMIEQVCSMALTYAHSDGRERVRAGATSSRR